MSLSRCTKLIAPMMPKRVPPWTGGAGVAAGLAAKTPDWAGPSLARVDTSDEGYKKAPRMAEALCSLSIDIISESQRSGLNRRPLDYESSALPLSYCGKVLRVLPALRCRLRPAVYCMPWRGLEPRRLAAPPPQDGVSTNFTTRACTSLPVLHLHLHRTGLTGLEPATSGVTDRHSNQLSYSPK